MSDRLLVLSLSLAMLAGSSAGQISGTASTRIAARVRSSVTVSMRTVEVAFDLSASDGARNHFAIPLLIKWNLNPMEVRGFEVIGYFPDPDVALADAFSEVAIPSANVVGRLGSLPYRPFSGTASVGPAEGGLLLFRSEVSQANRRGQQQTSLELEIEDAFLTRVPKGSYRGTLYLEARYY